MIPNFETKHLPKQRDVVAPDGSDVRILLGLKGGGMAHFELAPGETSRAVTHRTVEEIWFFISGRGEMWREQDGEAQVVDVYPGVCLTIPLGTCFQFRCTGQEPLAAIGVTMPPWPGEGEAVLVEGPWQATVGGGFAPRKCAFSSSKAPSIFRAGKHGSGGRHRGGDQR